MNRRMLVLSLLLVAFSASSLAQSPGQPSLLSPPNNSTNVSATPTFMWRTGANATAYQIQVSTNLLFLGTVVNVSGITDTTYIRPTAFNASTKYYWRVRSQNASGNSNWTSSRNFTTAAPAPAAPTLLSPEDGATGVSTLPTLSWNSVSGATSYALQVAIDTGFDTLILDQSNLTSTSLALPALVPNITHYWRVNASNAGGVSPWSTVWSFTTFGSVPLPPELVSPLDSATNIVASPLFLWNASQGADSYGFQLATDTAFTNILVQSAGNTGLSILLSSPLANGATFFWRMNATNAVGTGEWGTSRTFTVTGTIPNPPELISPADTAIDLPTTLTLQWSSSEGADSYTLQVSSDSLFTSILINTSGITTTEQQLSGLMRNLRHYWRVSATNAIGTSGWSAVRSFVTVPENPDPPALLEPANNATELSKYPTFLWTAAARATHYEIQITLDPTFAQIDSDYSNSNVVGESYTPTEPLGTGITYYWRMRSINTGGMSAWSPATGGWNFTTHLDRPTAPLLYSPVNGATNQRTFLLYLSWWAQTDSLASTYQLQVSTDSLFTTLRVNVSNITATQRAVSLSSGTLYYWRVRGKNAAGESDWSEVWHFRTKGTPRSPVLFVPANNAGEIPLTPTFEWGSVEEASGYQLQVSSNALFTQILLDTTTVSDTVVVLPNALEHNLTYFWRVRAINEEGPSAWTPLLGGWVFTTLLTIPAPPTLVSPIDGATGISLTPTFEWNLRLGAFTYRLQLATDAGFTNVVLDTAGVTTTSLALSAPLVKLSTYYWRVNASNFLGTGNWSTARGFTTAADPPLILTNPENQTVFVSQSATFHVSASGTGLLAYRWQKNGTDIDGAISATYMTPPTTLADNGATFRCVVSNAAGSTTSNTAALTVNAVPPGTIISDDFSRPTLNTAVWQVVNPGMPSTFSMVGTGTRDAGLSIALPAGASHDIWNGNMAPRVMQAAANTDFELEVKFEMPMTAQYEMAGILVEQDAQNYLRFDFVRDASNLRAFAASFVAGSPTVRLDRTIPIGTPLYLRVKRVGNQWTESYSNDGTVWTDAPAFTHALTVSAVGPFIANHGEPASASPAFTGIVDYFFNTALPIVPEDGVSPTVVPPSIGTHPANQIVAIGQSATFTVAAGGTEPLLYRWQKNGADIDGATGSTYATPPVAMTDNNASFRCVVSNATGSATSNTALLTVTDIPPAGTILSDDFSNPTLNTALWQIVNPGAPSEFSLAGTGTQDAGLSIAVPAGASHDVWQSNFAPRIMQTVNNSDFEVEVKFEMPMTDQYQIAGIIVEQDPQNFMRFDFVRDAARLRVFAASFVGGGTSVKSDREITTGTPLYMRVKRIGNQWTQSYSTNGTTWSVAGTFAQALAVSCVGPFIGNHGEPASSSPAFTGIIDYFFNTAIPVVPEDGVSPTAVPPSITEHPANKTAMIGQSASFNVAASGTGPMLYRWQKNGANIDGATGAAYTLPAVAMSDNGATFRCIVSNAAGSATSNTATLTVNDVPPGTIISDDFSSPTLNTALWSVVNPGISSQFSIAGTGTRNAGVSIAIPVGASHDVWNGNHAPRIMQAVANTDFEIEVKLDMPMTAHYQMAGIIVEQDAQNFLRFDFVRDPARLRAFAASFVGGNPTVRCDQTINLAPPLYLRVKRVGNQWTQSYSNDGTAWTVAMTFTHALAVSAVGPFVGNHGQPESASPAFTGVIDYFFNTAFPIVPEDPIPPTIVAQPVDRRVMISQSTAFSVVADGTPPFSYQWQKNGIAIDGATSALFTLHDAALTDNDATLRCLVSNHAGTALSDTAHLTVTLLPCRVTADLQALYVFTEGSGTTVNDVSGIGMPLNLTIANPGATNWLPQGLSILEATTVATDIPATKVVDASMASGELTIETWLRSADSLQNGPARIVTLSTDVSNRNFSLEQGTLSGSPSAYEVRLRTTATSPNGIPSLETAPGLVSTNIVHLVYTRNANGESRIYINGLPRAADSAGGDFANWNAGYRLGLASELDGGSPWKGNYHLVAVYGRALSQLDVLQNFLAGIIAASTNNPPVAKGNQNLESLASSPDIPTEFGLSANYPNPFNPATTIRYQLPEPTQVEISVYNALGERIAVLVNEVQAAGKYQVVWSGRNSKNQAVASGVYFYRMQAGTFSSLKKMLMVK